MEAARYITPAGWAFRLFFVIEIVVCIWAFVQSIDLGMPVLVICVDSFFIAYFLTSMIDNYLDERYGDTDNESEVCYRIEGGKRIRISCTRFVYGREPLYVFVDGVLYAKLYRGTETEFDVEGKEIHVGISRAPEPYEDDKGQYIGEPTDLRIVFSKDEEEATHIAVIRSDEKDESEQNYREFIGSAIGFEAEMLVSSIIITFLMSLRWII